MKLIKHYITLLTLSKDFLNETYVFVKCQHFQH